jgi:hypothetical protein
MIRRAALEILAVLIIGGAIGLAVVQSVEVVLAVVW